ncbi:oligosaccharide flippase family protein [Porphyromonas macacae]|uniref:oligosaccharide flippase family protein n=1 Tax=Porphyromonas macacae TaxID=28115 RepID=UPI0004680EDB|nr:oligosaccharide flippase family protein [Porphyromonas macacae]
MITSTVEKLVSTTKHILKQNKILLSNMSYLAVFQILILILPLISYPYLVRMVGSYNYGMVVYAQAFSAFFIIIINFGLNIYAAKDISINRNFPQKLDEIVTKVYIIKGGLFILIGTIYITCIFLFKLWEENRLLYIISYGYCLSEWFLPIWYFQGIEKMKYMTIIDSISKILFTLLIFIFIHKPTQYLFIPLLQIAGSMVGAIIAFYLLFKIEKRSIKRLRYSHILEYMRISFPFFLSRISVVAIAQLTTIFIGKFLGYIEVAWYDLAKKIWSLFMLPANIINTAIYPRIAYTKSIKLVRNIFYLQLSLSIILYIILLLSSNLLVTILGGVDMIPAISTVRFYGVMIIICYMTYFLGTPVMVPFGLEKQFNKSVILSLGLYILLLSIIWIANTISLSIFITIVIFSEICIFIYRFFFL